MKSMTKRIVLLPALLITQLLSLGQETIEKTITIEPNLSFENYEHFKRLILDSPDSRVEFLNDFNFEWGFKVKLLVKETQLRETLSDGTQFEYEFIKIVSKTKVPDSLQFYLTVDPQRYYNELKGEEAFMNQTLKKINDSTYLYFDKVEIEVPAVFRAKFLKTVKDKTRRRGRFEYVNEKRIRLVYF
jgi:hypothetical protein